MTRGNIRPYKGFDESQFVGDWGVNMGTLIEASKALTLLGVLVTGDSEHCLGSMGWECWGSKSGSFKTLWNVSLFEWLLRGERD